MKNNLIILFLLLCASLNIKAQNITNIEYFFDTDPGFGNATPVAITPDSIIVNLNFNAPVASLSEGVHQLYIRSKDANGNWSVTNRTFFYKIPGSTDSLSGIASIEYFFDTDPGFGNATPVAITPDSIIVNLNFNAPVASLSEGVHQLYIRSKDGNGNWSVTNRTFFYKIPGSASSIANIASIEYFLDTDPGFGNGSTVTVTPSADIANLNIAANVSSLSDGVHQLYIRSKDVNGNWSVTNRTFFYKIPGSTGSPSGIASIEYFFDTDPGFGNGSTVTVTPSTDIANLNIAANVSSLTEGVHQLYIRSKDDNGNWSVTNRTFFYKIPGSAVSLSNIVAVEYFYDTDPGFGNATQVTVVPSTNIANLNFANDLCSLPLGPHKIFVRSKDANGSWSVTNYKSIDVQQSTYYVDADHDGYGNPSISQISCSQPLGYVADSSDCIDTDSLQHPNQIWFTDIDHDHYGTGVSVTQCTRPANKYAASELISTTGDCDDTNPAINPGAQHFTFSGTPNFTSLLISQLNGNSYSTFNFEVNYYDSSGAFPPATFPRVILDYEGNNVYTDPNDRVIIMTADDANDLNTLDGKKYIASISSLPIGTNYQTSIQTTTNGCTTKIGPFNYPDVLQQPDIEIFANDITFSTANPPVLSPLTLSAVIHNESDYAAQNFVVRLRNQFDTTIVYPNITVTYLPPHGTYTVSWNITTPAVPAWCPMEVKIDYTNVIAETNELDNAAIRPFINGNYNLPGGIEATSYVSPFLSNAGAYTALYGSAHYVGTPIPLPDSSVAGATVNFTIIETGASYSTYSNSYGNFYFPFPSPLAVGTYHIQGNITDFTFTANFNTTFQIVGCFLPDLQGGISVTNLTADNYRYPSYIADMTIVEGNSIIGVTTTINSGYSTASGSVSTISNIGSAPAIGSVSVPSLNVGGIFNTPFNIVYNTAGHYSFCNTVDANSTVNECVETNNSMCKNIQVLPALPDISPYAGPGGTYNSCQISSVSFTVANYGGAATGPFNCTIIKRFNGTITGTETVIVPTIISGLFYPDNRYSLTIPFTPTSSGTYTFEVQCDLPNNTISEASESNNMASYSITILTCKPNFTLNACPSCCENFDVESVDGNYSSGSNITLKGVLSNIGNLAYAGAVNIQYQLSNGTIYNDVVSINLASYTSVNVSKIISAPPLATQTLTITADPTNLIDELSEADNSITDNMCWDFYPDSILSVCNGYNPFWNHTHLVSQVLYASVGVGSLDLYDADTLHVKFEVSGPGLLGIIDLGNAELYQVEKTCYCPVVAYLPTSFVFPQVGTYTFRMTVDPDSKYTECNEGNNVLIRTVEVVNLPDMRILSQHIAPSLLNPQIGQAVSLNITYQNIGYPNINDQMKLKVLVDNQLLSTINNVNGLVTGDNATLSIPNTWSSNQIGVHVIRAIIDAENTIAETNETNNEATRVIVVGASANLYFQVFTSLSLYPAISNTMNVKARVGNSGDLACEADMQLYYVNNNVDTILFHTTHISLNNHDSINFTIPWIVLDNKTTIIGKLINSSILEYTYDDNMAQFEIGKMNLIMNALPACGSNNNGTITATAIGGEPPYNFIWSNGFIGQTLNAPMGSYSVTATDITGQTVTSSEVIIVCPPVTLNLNLFIQGYYESPSQMASVLMNQGELNLPTDVDTITVELHDTLSPYTVIETWNGILQTDGTISCYFSSNVNTKKYYIVIKHRNLIETWSTNPVLLSTICSYIFSNDASKAYGNNQIEVENGVWAFYSGDINQDENIDLLDLTILENDITNFQFGYLATDINGDGNVDLLDAPLMEANINNFIFSNHP